MHPLKKNRGVEQLVARQAHNLEVARSNPASATRTRMCHILFFFAAKSLGRLSFPKNQNMRVISFSMILNPIAAPTLVETIKLRMYEMGLTQTKLAEMLGLSTARLSEIITGKGEPSLKTGREISRKLNIDPAIVLGV